MINPNHEAGLGVLDASPVVADETIAIAVDAPQHARPRTPDDEQSALVRAEFFAGFIDNRGIDPDHRQRARAGLGRCRTGKRRDDMPARFGLPIGVHDRAALLPDGFVIPDPGFGVDRFADRPEDAQ